MFKTGTFIFTYEICKNMHLTLNLSLMYHYILFSAHKKWALTNGKCFTLYLLLLLER